MNDDPLHFTTAKHSAVMIVTPEIAANWLQYNTGNRNLSTQSVELITRDEGWPEAEGDQIIARRPMLAALADMCDAWAVDNTDILGRVQETWTPEGERREPNTEN